MQRTTSATASGPGSGSSAPSGAGRRRRSPTGRGCTAPTSAAIERGEQNLSLVNIERLAATLGVSLAELFAPFTDTPAPPT